MPGLIHPYHINLPRRLRAWEMLCHALLFRRDHLALGPRFTVLAALRKPFNTKQCVRIWRLTWRPMKSRRVSKAVFPFMSKQPFVTIQGWDRHGLERLVRYCARPPLSQERLGRLNDETLVYSLRNPTIDGLTELMELLCNPAFGDDLHHLSCLTGYRN